MANKKKITTGIIAGVTAVALALGGTFAWQSISQTALNEKEAVINPGGRLHDDFDGTNKDVYVENFADEDIFARIRLSEYFEIVMNKGTNAETTQVVTTGAVKDDTDTYITHKFDDENTTDDWWSWTTGGETVFMPTFNKNKDSLKADVNGTMGYTDEDDNAKPYGDYVKYTEGQEVTDDAIYDNDSNNVEDDNVTTVEETHKGTKTGTAKLISMDEWLELAEDGEDTDNYWVYDEDGWVYWSSPIEKGTATGLLLDGISLNQVMDDSYYYAINVEGQFITADDLGKDEKTGFYAYDESIPSDNALKLLEKIGVKVDTATADDDNTNEEDGDGTQENPFKLTANLAVRGYESTEANGTLTYNNVRGAWIYDSNDNLAGIMSTDIKDLKGNEIEVDEYDWNYVHRFEVDGILQSEFDDSGNDRYLYKNEENDDIIISYMGSVNSMNLVEFKRDNFSGEQEFTMHIEYNKDGVYYKSAPFKIIVTGSKESD